VLAEVPESSDGAMQLSLSAAGSVVYLTGQADEDARKLVWVDRNGNALPLAAPDRPYSSPRLSPDGRMLAVTLSGDDRDEVWSFDIARNVLTQVTFEGGASPVWTSSGQRLAFSASRSGPANIFWKETDDPSSGDERLTRSPSVEVPGSSSADGRTIAYVRRARSTGYDILLLDTRDRTSRPFADSPANESAPALSPDGRLIAWVSDASGRNEVYVSAVGDPARKLIVSSGGGSEPLWSADGWELFFRSGNRMMAAAVKRGGALALEAAAELFEGDFETGVAARAAYDVSADGARFLMVARDTTEVAPPELRVLLGWDPGSAP
jgi:Tol biopolymer transport system component